MKMEVCESCYDELSSDTMPLVWLRQCECRWKTYNEVWCPITGQLEKVNERPPVGCKRAIEHEMDDSLIPSLFSGENIK